MYKFDKNYYADVRIERRISTNIAYKNGVLEESKVVDTNKAFVRVYDGAMWYYSSTTDVDNVQEELEQLYQYATPNKDIAKNGIVAKLQVNKDKLFVFDDCKVSDVDIKAKHQLLTDKMDMLKSPYSNLSNAIYIDRYSHYQFYSSKGSNIEYDHQACGYRLMMTFANNGDQINNSVEQSDTKFTNLVAHADKISDMIAEGENYVVNAKSVVAGQYPVVLAPMVTGVFTHESFGHKSEADFMLGDETMAREWSLGKKVGSDILTILESGQHLGTGYVPYDDEGTKATKTYLIKDGVLQGRLHSATTAQYLGEELTGNARAINCDYEPIVRMTNTYIDKGDSTVEELIAGIEHGYYIKDVKHGSGMSTFTIAPSLCYEIKNGKICDPVKIAVITGNVFETLSLIDGVGDDLQLLSFLTGGCGKMEQYPLNVGMGGPHIRVSKMSIQ